MQIERLAIFCSGNGSNLQAIIDACKEKSILAEIVLVLVDRPCFALERAKQAGIATKLLDRKAATFHDEVILALRETRAEGIVLAGYLSILDSRLISAYPMKIINVHPSLLPLFGGKGFYGLRVHKAVLDAGCKISGATVHFVEEGVDKGPIIAQESISVYAEDRPEDIAERVHPIEHKILLQSLSLFCEGRLSVQGRMVHISEE